MSAHKKEVTFSRRIEVRVTPDDYTALKIKARKQDVSICHIVRDALNVTLENE